MERDGRWLGLQPETSATCLSRENRSLTCQTRTEHYRGRALALIERTFSSISLSKLEDLLGETDEDALKTILREGWSFDGEKKVVSIQKKGKRRAPLSLVQSSKR